MNIIHEDDKRKRQHSSHRLKFIHNHSSKRSESWRDGSFRFVLRHLDRAPTGILISGEDRLRLFWVLLVDPEFLAIRDRQVVDVDVDFVPFVAGGGDRHEAGEQVVHTPGDDESAKEVDVVHVLRADGDITSHGTDESDDIYQNSSEVGCVAVPREAKGIEVRPMPAGAVKFLNIEEPLADEVIVRDDNSSNGGEKDGVGRESCRECTGARNDIPL